MEVGSDSDKHPTSCGNSSFSRVRSSSRSEWQVEELLRQWTSVESGLMLRYSRTYCFVLEPHRMVDREGSSPTMACVVIIRFFSEVFRLH